MHSKKLFNLSQGHLTLRRLILKFIRVNDTASGNIIRYLPGLKSNNTMVHFENSYLILVG